MHTQNPPPNVGNRQGQFGGPPPRHFGPPPPNAQGFMYAPPPRVQNPGFVQHVPHYTELPQINHGALSECATSPPSVASTPGPPLSNKGHPLQPGPPVYYNQPPLQQQQQQIQRFQQPPPALTQQPVLVMVQPPRGRQTFVPRPPQPQMMQYQMMPQNYNQRFAMPYPPPQFVQTADGQFFDPQMQQQQPLLPLQQHQPYYPKNNYQGKNRGRGNGNSSQHTRRGSRPDSTNRPPSHPSPESQFPQFADQNIAIPQGQIMQHNPMFQMQPAMLQQGQQYYAPPQDQSMAGQPYFIIQGDPNFQPQQPQYLQYQMVQQMPMQHQINPMDQQQQFIPPQNQMAYLPSENIVQAIEELKRDTKDGFHVSPEKGEPAGVPALDAASVQGDVDDYTPPGTPQSLNPLNEQQMDSFVASMNNEDSQKGHDAKEDKADSKSKQEARKRQPKPEQQHYQPPAVAGRPNARRTDSWRSNSSQQSTSLSKIAEEKPKPAYPTVPILSEPLSQSSTGPSDTPTPRASPISTAASKPVKAKEVTKTADVPMIGGVPLLPTIGGKPLVLSGSVKAVDALTSASNEHCTYCESLGKTRHEITNHSTYSSKGIPACPAFRDDGCKLCGAKGDSAHLEEFCKKKVNKENVEFKQLAGRIMNMTPEEKKAAIIKDVGKHPTVLQVVSYPNEQFQKDINAGLNNLFVEQEQFKRNSRSEWVNQKYQQTHMAHHHHQLQHQQPQYNQRNYYSDDRGYRGHDRGGNRSRGNNDHRGGGRGGGGRSGTGQTYAGSRSRDFSQGSSGGGGGSSGGRGAGGGGGRGGSGGGYNNDRRSRGGGNAGSRN